MNKIYKVVWSKAKHCYVVTSELAKRNGKGCGARSLRMATVSMGVAAVLLGGFGMPVAEAETVSKLTHDYTKAYLFQTSPKSLAVDQAMIDAVTGGKYVYGNVQQYGDTSTFTDVYYTIENNQSVRHLEATVFFDQSYSSILTKQPFSDDTRIDQPAGVYIAMENSDSVKASELGYNTLGEYVKNLADANTDVSGYSVTLTGTGLIDAAGALSWGGNVTNNSITVNGGQANTVYGGNTSKGNANENTVTIGSGASKAGNVYGGYASGYPASGNANTNHVNVNGGTVEYTLWGGYSVMGNASANEVNVTSGSIGYSLYGGYSDNANANSNRIAITGGAVATAEYAGVYGGNAYNGTANGNEVIVSGTASVANVVCGGDSGTEANGNTVTISGGTVNSTAFSGAVVGGMNGGGAADKTENGNKVFINGTATVTGDVTGGKDGYYTATASENTVTIDGSAVITGNVMGADGKSRDKTKNKVYINKDYTGSVTGNVYGARLDDSGNYWTNVDPNDPFYDGGNTTSNEVHISGGTVTGNVYGGALEKNVTGDVDGNKVFISGGTVNGNVDGGYSENGLVKNNKVDVSGGTVTGHVYGGESYSGSADAESNEVAISKGTVNDVVFGAFVRTNSTGNAKNNKVAVSGTAVMESDVHGAQVSGGGNAIGNSVTVDGGTVNTAAVGASTIGKAGNAGSVEGNAFTMSGGSVGFVFGGYSDGGSYNGGTVTGNTVAISGGSVGTNVIGGVSYSDSAASGDATNNTVTISAETGETTIGNNVIGGRSNSDTGVSGNANSNVVAISGGTISGKIYGGETYTDTGTAGNANNNEVTVSGGTVNGNVYGGYGYSAATGNTVTLGGGTEAATVASDVYGGFVTNGTANDNTVNLKGNTNLAGASLYGSNKTDSTGNELHVGGVKGETVSSSENIWKSSTDNKVVTVANFNTIALHDVAWSTSVAALETTTMTNIGTLDIKNLKFYEGGSVKTNFTTDESMSLLKSGSDLSAVTLTYNGGTGVAITTEGVVISGSTDAQTEETGVGGVKLTTKGGSETVKLSADSKSIDYSKVAGGVTGITFGEATFVKDGIARDLSGTTIEATNTVNAAALTFKETNEAVTLNDSMTLVANAAGITTTVDNGTGKTVAVNYTDDKGIAFGATATGDVTSADSAVKYNINEVKLNSVDLSNWQGSESEVPDTWILAGDATINTDGMTAPTVAPGEHIDILKGDTDNYFAAATISGANAYNATDFEEDVNGVILAGKQDKGVTINTEKKHLIYAVGTKNANSIDIGAVTWQQEAFDATAGYDFTNVNALGTDNFAMSFAEGVPQTLAVNDSMTLLDAANANLAEIAAQEKATAYQFTPVTGVTVDANITGNLAASGNKVTYTVAANQANRLTFGNVEWKDTGALLDHSTTLTNVSFDGAAVDTTNINFTNIQSLEADRQMTLVSGFGGAPASITGTQYRVGAGLVGEGAASLSGNDLVFTTTSGAEALVSDDATHETVMAMEAGTAVVDAGREFVDNAIEGLGLISNMAPDGTSTFAAMGGGAGRYKTGSHVDTHTWNAVVAVGRKQELKKGDLEWGVFAEYGRGNYTLHDDNNGRGDGNTHYAGGGLLAKWTNKHNVYTEASIRMGRVSDSASNMLWNGAVGYGYDVHANYYGGHVGLGKVIKVKTNRDLDVYGKFFYTKRNGVSFDAGGNHYELDSVDSSLLRVGARYGSNDRKWNWYGGLAYEYEFGGESKGTVDGIAIRSASIKGASVRGELGMRMEASKTNPWKVDVGIYGYGGKHRGIGGTVSVAYMF